MIPKGEISRCKQIHNTDVKQLHLELNNDIQFS